MDQARNRVQSLLAAVPWIVTLQKFLVEKRSPKGDEEGALSYFNPSQASLILSIDKSN